MAKRAEVMTHGSDLDGIAFAAIAKLHFRDYDANIRYVDYPTRLAQLEEVARLAETREVDAFTMGDLGMNPKTGAQIIAQLSRISEYAEVTFIDHHSLGGWGDDLRKHATLVHDGEDVFCTAELAWLHYLPDDPLAMTLGTLAHISDFRPAPGIYSKEECDLAYKLNKVVVADQSHSALSLIVKDLVDGVLWSPRLNGIYEARVNLEAKERDAVLSKRLVTCEVLSPYLGKVSISYSHSDIYTAEELAGLMSRELDSDLMVGVNSASTNVILYRRRDSTLDVSAVCNVLGGGGHPDRGGFGYDCAFKDGAISTSLIDTINTTVSNYRPVRTE